MIGSRLLVVKPVSINHSIKNFGFTRNFLSSRRTHKPFSLADQLLHFGGPRRWYSETPAPAAATAAAVQAAAAAAGPSETELSQALRRLSAPQALALSAERRAAGHVLQPVELAALVHALDAGGLVPHRVRFYNLMMQQALAHKTPARVLDLAAAMRINQHAPDSLTDHLVSEAQKLTGGASSAPPPPGPAGST